MEKKRYLFCVCQKKYLSLAGIMQETRKMPTTITHNAKQSKTGYIPLEKFRKPVYQDTEKFCTKQAISVVPEGYMTHSDFWNEADKRIVNICKQYGVL